MPTLQNCYIPRFEYGGDGRCPPYKITFPKILAEEVGVVRASVPDREYPQGLYARLFSRQLPSPIGLLFQSEDEGT